MKTDSIWKDNKTLPEMGKLIVNKNKECGKFWPESGGGIVYFSSNTCDFNKFGEWCYLDDLLEQSSKIERLEKELSGIENKIKHAKS